jgi:hypothetical protein
MNSKVLNNRFAVGNNKRIGLVTLLYGLSLTGIGVLAQDISIPASTPFTASDPDCDNLIYAAREMYSRGELPEMIQQLEPCITNEDLVLRQRRALYRMLAEAHLYVREYPQASEYARKLVEIDPKLQVYGISRLHTRRKGLRTAIQSSQYVDAPDLLLLVGKIRYRAWGLEVFGDAGPELLSVKSARFASGVTEVSDQSWSGAQHASVGLGFKYDPYRFPLTLTLRFRRSDVSFTYSERQVIESTPATFSFVEKQGWLSPELWFGYQFATKTFPVKNFDIALRAGMGFDILTKSVLEGALLDRVEGADWYGGQERDITDMISQKIFPAALGGIAIDYRIGRQSVFAELQYRHPFADDYLFDIPVAPYASDVRSVHRVGLQVGVRFVFYKAFFK